MDLARTRRVPRHGAIRASARALLLIVLALVAIGTVAGLILLWPSVDPRPDGPENAFAAPGVTFEKATVELVQPVCRALCPG